ncbi:hypothetical protein ONZ51_g12411 [Trametes cubensis]|uniref:Fe2OG dioxygenase domain-containing protein n=1 Tax=Trametes cubensis TaxID=1111947 RepID=A0AAD7TGL6_9APHY|nr:hypothetical protein ONZ51_g12411 [Trametes cubensis]
MIVISKILPRTFVWGDLADILSGDLEFAGTFSFSKTYPAAPNPALAVGDIGTIGLPLSTRDAAAIKAHAEQAPFGKADRTIVDKSVRDTWEIDAKEVRFDNPAWTTFLDNVIREVCEVLGVDVQASKPFCELYKLLLYETGSHFLPHVDTEKVNGMFATVVIVLPSKFTGGEVQVKHGDMTQVYDCSAGSLHNTTVLAWYTDVEHEVKAVTSGYRLALSFNLMHTTNSLRPTLSVNNLPARLRRVLLSWERGKGDTDAPAKIIYLLSHKYSHANLSGSALKGVDAHLIAVLDNVGRPYGIHIGLANLTCTQRGSAEDYGDSSYRWGRCAYDDDVGMMEVEDTEVVIEHLVDLDGRLIQESVTCDIEFEVIPDELVDEITAGDYDDQEYEGYQGNYAGSLERFYRRTVLVMWPSWAHFDMIHGSNGLSYACQKIRASTSSHPTAEEKELVDIILARAGPSHCAAVVSSLCHTALVWRDLSLWTRAVKKCNAERSVTTLQEGNILKAVKTFGFSSIQPCLERTLENDPSSIFALQFLERFEVWVASQNVEELSITTKDWIAAQRTRCFEHLKTPGKDEHESLTALALKYGGIEFLETRIIPRVISSGESPNILEFALFIGKKDSVDSEARTRMAKALLAAALSGIDFYSVVPPAPTKTPAYYPSYNSVPETSAQLERAKQYLGACLDFDFDDLLATTVDKLLGLAGQPDTVVLSRVKEILFPLIAFTEERLRSRPGSISPPALRKLSSTASSLYIKSVMARPTAMSPYDVSSMIQAVISAGEPDQVITQVVPKLEGLKLDVSVLRSIIEEVHRRRAQIDPDGTRVKSALLRLLKKYIGGISLVAPTYSASYYLATVNRTKPVLEALEFCFTVQLPEGCTFVFQRLLNPPKLDSQYITTQLAPLVPDIRPFLMKHKLPLNQEPFATALRAIMLYWGQKVTGPRPSEVPQTYMNALRAWTCRCEICPAVRAFLTSKPEESMSWTRIGAPKRKHVENFLATHARAIATYDTIRSTPQGLIVKKNQILVAPARWTHNQKEGKRLLASISSNVDELKAVLGADYLRITALLDGLTVPASASTDAAAGSSRRRLAQQAAGGQQLPPAAPAASGSLAHHGTAPGVSTLQAPTISQGPSQNIQASRMSQTLSSAGPVPVATTSAGPSGVSVTVPTPIASGAAIMDPSTASHTVDQPPAKRRKMAYNAHDVIDLT